MQAGRSTTEEWVMRQTGADTTDALRAWQLCRLGEVLRYARENSAYYARLLKDTPDEPRSTEGLPFTWPRDLAAHGREMLCQSQSAVDKIVTLKTTGTTSAPKRMYFGGAELERTVDFFTHGMQEFTRAGDLVFILLPCAGESSVGQLLGAALARFGARAVFYGVVQDFAHLMDSVRRQEANVLVGLPQQLLELARLCAPDGVALPHLHSALTAADHSPIALVRAVESGLGCTVYDNYGMTELCFGGGVFSQTRDGYHLRHNDFLFEIVDPESGRVLPEGEYGEVVFTTLTPNVLPLIRYRTGDVSRLLPGRFPRLGKLCGRVDSLCKLPNGASLSLPQAEDVLFDLPGVLDMKVILEGATVLFEVRALSFDRDRLLRHILQSELGERLNGLTVEVRQAMTADTDAKTMRKRRIVVQEEE